MTQTSSPDGISVVVCTKDRSERLTALLDALARQTRLPDEVIVVDASALPLDPEPSRTGVRVVRDAGKGLAAARNQGAEAARHPLVLYVDDDIVPPGDLVERILAAHAEWPLAAAIGGVPVERVAPSKLRVFFLRVFQRGPFFHAIGVVQAMGARGALRVERLSTSVMSVKRDLLLRHRFDENLVGPSVGEDADLSLRLAREHPVLLLADLFVQHEGIGWNSRPLASKFERKVYSYAYLYEKDLRGRRGAGLQFAWLLVGITAEAIMYGLRHGTRQPVLGVARALRRLRVGLDGAGGFIDKDPRKLRAAQAASRAEPTVGDRIG